VTGQLYTLTALSLGKHAPEPTKQGAGRFGYEKKTRPTSENWTRIVQHVAEYRKHRKRCRAAAEVEEGGTHRNKWNIRTHKYKRYLYFSSCTGDTMHSNGFVSSISAALRSHHCPHDMWEPYRSHTTKYLLYNVLAVQAMLPYAPREREMFSLRLVAHS